MVVLPLTYYCRNESGKPPIKTTLKITTMQFLYGFIYKEVRYGWKDKKLFRLPFESNKRTYGLKEIPQYVFKSTPVYNIQKTKLTINRLKSLTQKVDWNVEIIEHSNLPF